ncbi:MAG TPA: hypothetical protein VJQ55_16360 [Candidatus Binatia bacterium]|nr:hypothetical protein [Candidatus Binatia bacterium]
MAWGAKIRLAYSPADAKYAFVFLLAFEIVLVIGYCVVHIIAPYVKWGPIKPLIDLNLDVAIPAWFSTIQLFAISVLLFISAGACDRLRRYLIIFGFGFMFLSMDEAAAIHEKIIDTAKRLDWHWLLSLTLNGSHRAWMIPYAIVGVFVIAICYRFFALAWRDFYREGLIVATGLAVFAIGGVGFELIGFHFEDHPSDAPYAWAVAAEEFFEMAGMTVVLYGILLFGIKAPFDP